MHSLSNRCVLVSTQELPPGFGPNDRTAPDRAETDYAPCGFKLGEHHPHGNPPQADPWIMVQIDDPGLKVLRSGNAYLGFEFRDGVSIEDTSRLAREMDRLLVGVSCTKFIT